MGSRPLGWATTAVLRAIRDGHGFGADVMDATELSGGSVYKILRRLEKRGMVEGRWENPEVAEAERRPRRRYYDLTGEGEEALAEALARFRALMGDVAPETAT